jgi:hypothetical protein
MRRRTAIGILVVAVIVVGGLVAFVLSQQRVRDLTSQGDRVNILVLAIDDRAEPRCHLAAVISLAPEQEAGILILPSALRMRFADAELAALIDRYPDISPEAARDAVAAFLGVEIPYHVEIDDRELEGAIDALDGLSIAVEEETPCVETVSSGDGPPYDGATIVEYLRCSEALSRDHGLRAHQRVLAAILSAGLRQDGDQRAAARAIHPRLRTNLSLVDFLDLARIATRAKSETPLTGILPVIEQAVEGRVVLEPRIVETTRLVARLLEGNDFLTPADVRVAVFNGNGARDIAKHTAAFLRARSFPVVYEGNADSFDYERTLIVHFGDGDKARLVATTLPGEKTLRTADAFEPHLSVLRPYIPGGTDVLVVLGRGFEVDDG